MTSTCVQYVKCSTECVSLLFCLCGPYCAIHNELSLWQLRWLAWYFYALCMITVCEKVRERRSVYLSVRVCMCAFLYNTHMHSYTLHPSEVAANSMSFRQITLDSHVIGCQFPQVLHNGLQWKQRRGNNLLKRLFKSDDTDKFPSGFMTPSAAWEVERLKLIPYNLSIGSPEKSEWESCNNGRALSLVWSLCWWQKRHPTLLCLIVIRKRGENPNLTVNYELCINISSALTYQASW